MAIGFGCCCVMVFLIKQAFDLVFPDRLSLNILGRSVSAAHLHQRVLRDGLVPLLMLLSVLAWELAAVGWADSSLRRLTVARSRSSRTDLAVFLIWESRLMNVLIVVMSLGLVLASGGWIHDRLVAATGWPITVAGWPAPVQVLLVFLIYSFLDYWAHRLDHSRWLWPLHRYHHAAEDFCVLTAVRTHPATFSGVVCISVPIAILAASPEAMLYVNLINGALRYVIHSRMNSDFGWIGRYGLQSPVHHRRHHVQDRSERTGHFGLVPLWDHLFGTWGGDADQTLVIGVDTPYRHGLWLAPDLWRDYLEFWRGLIPRFGR